jgi:hypothetical protein
MKELRNHFPDEREIKKEGQWGVGGGEIAIHA